MQAPGFDKKAKLDEIYQLMFDYFITTLENIESAKSTDVKAAHDFLASHNYDFRMDDAAKAEENEKRAEEALSGIDDNEIRMIQGG